MADINETARLQSKRPQGGKSIDRRSTAYESADAATSAANSTEIEYRNYAGGTIFVRSGSGVTLTFYVAEQDANGEFGGTEGTYAQLYDTDNSAVSMTVAAGRAYPIPDECFGAAWLKIVANAALVLDVTLKG